MNAYDPSETPNSRPQPDSLQAMQGFFGQHGAYDAMGELEQQRRRQQASEQADTFITINQNNPDGPTAPPSQGAAYAPRNFSGHGRIPHVIPPAPRRTHSTASPAAVPGAKSSGQGIRWGKVIRGVVMVTAVVVVGIYATGLLAGMASSLFSTPAVAGAVAGVEGVVAPAAETVGGWLSSGLGFVWSNTVDFFAALFGGSGAATGAAATAGVTAAQAAATGQAAGSIAAAAGVGGTAIAGAVVAGKHIFSNMHTLADPSALAANTPMPDASLSAHHGSQIGAHKAATVAAQPANFSPADIPLEEAGSQALAQHTRQSPHYAGTHLELSTKMAKNLGHLAHEQHEQTHGADAIRHTAQTSRDWVARTAGNNSYRQTLHATGSQAEAVHANAGPRGAITPRQSAFAEQVEQDRAALDAALADPAR